jgi:DNA-binding NarL/FixJ family response regulator
MTTSEKTTCTILVTDDHPLFCKGVAEACRRTVHVKKVHEGHGGTEGLELLRKHVIDIVVLDCTMMLDNGTAMIEKVLALGKDTKVIVMTCADDEATVSKMLAAGVSGYLLKNKDGTDLMQAIKVVKKGDIYVDAEVKRKLGSIPITPQRVQAAGDGLTDRETEVMNMWVRQKSYEEIADALFISAETVKTHVQNLKNKLKAGDRADVIRYCILNGYMSMKEFLKEG